MSSRVPSTPDPSGRTVILEPTDYDRIIKSTRFLSMEDRKQLEKELKERENDHMEASNRRKKEMQEFEYLRRKNEKPSDLEQVGDTVDPCISEQAGFANLYLPVQTRFGSVRVYCSF